MCKAPDSVVEQTQELVDERDLILQIKRSPCYGTCPVDIITLYEDGSILYKGVKHTEHIGTYRAQLSSEQLKEISNLITQLQAANLPKSKYIMEHVMDLPSRIMTVNDQKITYQLSESPKVIVDLDHSVFEMLDKLELTKIKETNN